MLIVIRLSSVMRPGAEQTQRLIAVIAAAVIPDDHARPSRSMQGLGAITEDAAIAALRKFREGIKGVQEIKNAVGRLLRCFFLWRAAEGTALGDSPLDVSVTLGFVVGGHIGPIRNQDSPRLAVGEELAQGVLK